MLSGLYDGTVPDHDDVRALIDLLLEDGAPEFLPAIAGLLASAASDSDAFASTLAVLDLKTRRGGAADMVLQSVRSVGVSDSQTALRTAGRLLERDDPGCAHMLIGGAAARLPGECEALMRKLIASGEARLQISGIWSLIAAYADPANSANWDILGALERASESDDEKVIVACTDAFVAFYALDRPRCLSAVERLAARHPRCAEHLAYWIWRRPPLEEKTSLRLLSVCFAHLGMSATPVTYYWALQQFTGGHMEEVLRMILADTARHPSDTLHVGHVLEKIGLAHGTKAVEALVSAPMESANVRKCAPAMIKHVIDGAGRDGLGPVFDAIRSGPDLRKIGLEALRIITDPGAGDASVLEPIENFLKSLAESEGIDCGRATKGDTRQAVRCGRLIDAMLHPRRPDYGLARENIAHFPELDSRLGKPWISEQERGRQAHPLLHMLGQKLPLAEISAWSRLAESAKTEEERSAWTRKCRHESRAWCFLKDLDHDLAMLKNKHADAYARRLKNEDEFFDTRSEMDFVMQFLGRCEIDPEPRAGSKKLDARLRICGRNVYVEVFSPDRWAELPLFPGGRVVRERISGKIYDKVKKQLSELDGKDPVILAIDLGKSEISDSEVDRYVRGPTIGRVVVGKNAEAEESSELDASMSMHWRDPATDVISAIVCYNGLHGDLGRRMDYRIIPNPHARSKLSGSEIEFIEKCLDRERA